MSKYQFYNRSQMSQMSLIDNHWEYVSPRDGRSRVRCFCSNRSFFKTHISKHVQTKGHKSYVSAWMRSMRTEQVVPANQVVLSGVLSVVAKYMIAMNNGPLLRKFIKVSFIDVDAILSSGEPLIVFASSSNAQDAIRELIDMGADVNRMEKEPALLCAIRNENIETITMLLSNGADVNIALAGNISPLMFANQYSPSPIEDLILRATFFAKHKESRDCDICYESRTSFWKCPQCVHSHCTDCHFKLRALTCPGCRLEFK